MSSFEHRRTSVSQVHANINLGAQLQKRRVIVRAGPENAISGKIKRERWSERKISIFYEPFPLLPPGTLWLGTSNRIPSSLIPFSKNVIRKSPFGLSIAHSLPVWAQQRAVLHHQEPLNLSSQTYLSLSSHQCSEKPPMCCPFM